MMLNELTLADEVMIKENIKLKYFKTLKKLNISSPKENVHEFIELFEDSDLDYDSLKNMIDETEPSRFENLTILEAVVRKKWVIRQGKRKKIKTTGDDKTYVDASGKAKKKTASWMIKQKRSKKKTMRKMTSGKKARAVRKRKISMRKVVKH